MMVVVVVKHSLSRSGYVRCIVFVAACDCITSLLQEEAPSLGVVVGDCRATSDVVNVPASTLQSGVEKP